MPDTSDEDYENNFLVSPFIKGEDPKFLNIYYMDGGCSNFVKDGVEYCVADHDNIEAFAGRGVYLGVLGDTFYDRDAYNFDKTTGEITRNENYKGINALFGLPLDKSKADEEKAKKLLAKWKNGSDSSNDSENPDNEEDTKAKNNTVDETDWNKIKKNCTLIKGSVKTYPASQYGEMLSYSSGVTDKNGTTKDNWLIAVDEYFKEDEYGTKVAGTLGDSENSVYIVIKRSRNGKITVSKYQD